MAQRVAFLIGNQKFLPESGLLPLQGPMNDVAALARLLGDPDWGKFKVHEFSDKPAYEILPKIEQALRAGGEKDLFLIFYSGHGVLARNGQLFLATADTRRDAPRTTCIPARHLTDLVEESYCGQVVLLLDCCYSGAVGTKGHVSSELEVIDNAQGFYIITATTDMKSAREMELLPGGAVMGRFTAALVDGIESGAADRGRKGKILLSDLRHHLGSVVTGQTPQFFDRRASGDPLISLSPATAAPLLHAEVLADLADDRWHRRRGAVLALSDGLRDGDAATRAAARAALQQQLTKERDYSVRADLESALGLRSSGTPDIPRPEAPATETSAPPPDFDIEAARIMILHAKAPPSLWQPWIKELNFFEENLEELAPLADLTALQSLNLSGTKVSDVAPLAGLTALQSLNLSGTKVSDVAPLAGLTALQSLGLGRSEVSNVAPLARLITLQSLDLSYTEVSDVAPLADLTALQSLDLAVTKVSDVAPLARLIALQSLGLGGTKVSNVTPLARLTVLQSLGLCGITGSVAPLARLIALQSLDLSYAEVSDVVPLARMTALQSLNLSGTEVSDVAPLAGLTALRSLDLSFSKISDVVPLARMTALQSLDFNQTEVTDVAPLADLTALQSLNLSGTKVSDVAPLAGLAALQSLSLFGTMVSDVTALARLTALQSLDLGHTRVSNVAPLAGLTALQSLSLFDTKVSDVAPLAGLTAHVSFSPMSPPSMKS